MALNPCVKLLLCALGSGTLAAIRAVLEGQIAALNAEIVLLTTRLGIENVNVAPITAAEAEIQKRIDEVLAWSDLVPLDRLGACADIGLLNVNIHKKVDEALAEAHYVLDDFLRLLAFRDELQALIAEAEARLNFLEDVQLALEGC